MTLLDNPYFQNIASDLLTVLLLVAVGGFWYLLSRRRRLLLFFGCSRTRKITLYLSNLEIVRGGALDPEGRPRGYVGSSTPGYELPFIAAAYRLFLSPVPGLSSQPGRWKYIALRDVHLSVSPAPVSTLDINSNATIITVGSIGYNTVSRVVEEHFGTSTRLDPAGRLTCSDGTVYAGRGYALVEKCYNSQRKQWAFYVAGAARNETTGAFEYLVQNWARLRRDFGDSAFSIIIRIIDNDPSRCEVVRWWS